MGVKGKNGLPESSTTSSSSLSPSIPTMYPKPASVRIFIKPPQVLSLVEFQISLILSQMLPKMSLNVPMGSLIKSSKDLPARFRASSISPMVASAPIPPGRGKSMPGIGIIIPTVTQFLSQSSVGPPVS